MHGLDWDAVLAKYLPLVDRITSRRELNDLIGQLVGELSALHVSVRGGDLRQGRPVSLPIAHDRGARDHLEVSDLRDLGQDFIVDAVRDREFNLMMGALVVVSLVFVAVNLVADVVYACLDPRIRYA